MLLAQQSEKINRIEQNRHENDTDITSVIEYYCRPIITAPDTLPDHK